MSRLPFKAGDKFAMSENSLFASSREVEVIGLTHPTAESPHGDVRLRYVRVDELRVPRRLFERLIADGSAKRQRAHRNKAS